jgi:hypothetical protein
MIAEVYLFFILIFQAFYQLESYVIVCRTDCKIKSYSSIARCVVTIKETLYCDALLYVLI